MGQKRRIPILMYHSITNHAEPDFQRYTVSPTAFATQIAYLRDNNFTPLRMADLVSARRANTGLPEKPVLVTFDDGFADFYSTALPILKQHSFPATLFIATAFIGGTSRWMDNINEGMRPMLTWEQIKELQKWGIECGAHAHTHPELDMISASKAYEEIVQSKSIVEEKLGVSVTAFAYPYGYYSAQTRRLVQKAGFTAACGVQLEMSSESDDLFALPRLIVTPETDIDAFAEMMERETGFLEKAINRMKAVIWTAYRRITYTRRFATAAKPGRMEN